MSSTVKPANIYYTLFVIQLPKFGSAYQSIHSVLFYHFTTQLNTIHIKIM